MYVRYIGILLCGFCTVSECSCQEVFGAWKYIFYSPVYIGTVMVESLHAIEGILTLAISRYADAVHKRVEPD